MKFISIIILLIIFLSVCLFSQDYNGVNGQNKYDTSVLATISLDKYNYIEGESIYLSLDIINNLKENINIDKNVSLYLIIKNTKGEAIPYLGWDAKYKVAYYDSINFKSIKSFKVQLLFDYGTTQYGDSGFRKQNILNADNYSVYYEYFGDKIILKSNVVHFIVDKPVSEEEDAFEKLKQIYQIEHIGQWDWILRDAYINFLYSYPKSVYFEQTFYLYLNLHTISLDGPPMHDPEFIDVCNFFIQTKPNSKNLNDVFYWELTYMRDGSYGKFIINQFLGDILNSYPNTEAATTAKIYLKKLYK